MAPLGRTYMRQSAAEYAHRGETPAYGLICTPLLRFSFRLQGAVGSCQAEDAVCLLCAQGNARDELPESLLGTMRLCNVRTVCHCTKAAYTLVQSLLFGPVQCIMCLRGHRQVSWCAAD